MMKKLMVLLLSVFCLTACGGGGGGDSSASAGGATAPADRFELATNYVVKDNLTGLFWQRTGSFDELTWTEANTFCQEIGPTWRLPSQSEFVGLSYNSTTGLALPEFSAAVDANLFNFIPYDSWTLPYVPYWADTPPAESSQGFENVSGNYYNIFSSSTRTATYTSAPPLILFALCVSSQ